MPMEQRGVDTIPDEERTSGPRDLVSILFSANLCLGVIVFGWLPPSFGLGLWPSVTSIVIGTLAGVLVTAPLALISLRTATNLSTSSGAQFGVRGRLVGSVVGLLLSLGYTALTLWIGGDVMVGTLSRLFGLPDGGTSRALMHTMTSFVLLLTAIGTPWAVISLIGYVRCGGQYAPDALQVFNRRAKGGIYWYRAGWNISATVSWALGAAVGLAAVSTTVYEGPLLALTGGVDCSFIISGLVGGVTYTALT
ncbi:cytosine permease [Streptomyces sp. NPDC088246]|uniref:cytosine permease n=1 Tax=Streptomyces sp. NPDC088246 TaxID=3365842 RepID=UPI00382A8F88